MNHWSNFFKKHGNRKISVVTRFHSEPIPSWLFYLEIDKYRITEYPLIE